MELYKSPAIDLADYLTGETDVATDSVIDSAIPYEQVYVGAMNDKFPPQQVQLILKESTGIPNAKWLRDEWFIDIMTIGATRAKYVEAQSLLWYVANEFMARDTLTVGDKNYIHFTFTSAPKFIGYQDNSMPLFEATMRLFVDGLTDKFNRKTIA